LGVVVLGALVLLLVPDRPGGKIAWQGVEVSSVGAGLPLIVVGIAAMAISGGTELGGDGGGNGGAKNSGSQTTPALVCPGDLEERLSPNRVATVESGANAQIVAGPLASKTEPLGLLLTDGGEPVGAITFRFFPASGLFRVQSLVDADCRARQVTSLQPGEGALETIPNYGEVRIDLMGTPYLLDLGGGGDIRVNFSRFAP
jgi:hypothetical protein